MRPIPFGETVLYELHVGIVTNGDEISGELHLPVLGAETEAPPTEGGHNDGGGHHAH